MPNTVVQPRSAPPRVNVADRLAQVAEKIPDSVAVAAPGGTDVAGRNCYSTCTFRQLDADADALARGLKTIGVASGERLVLLVRPGVEFVKLVFALLRSGATTVLIDPGMPRRHLIDCLARCEPDGFVAISQVQAVRTLLHKKFSVARHNVTVGRRWFWSGPTYRQLVRRGRQSDGLLPTTGGDDPAAIIFTSGSTGPPKGVLYTHQMFATQVREISEAYQLGLGGVDLACFPLFGLFNSALGVTTVFPKMDFSRPASACPKKLLAAANDWQATQAFASPAVWDKLSRYCGESGERIPTLRSVFSCGAPVAASVLERTLRCVHPDARMHTPYGATECLPVSTIEAREVLGETAAATASGQGVCVGRKFASIDWKVIQVADGPVERFEQTSSLPTGHIGELVVRGPQVSPCYVTCGPNLAAACPASSSLGDEENGDEKKGDEDADDRANRLAKIVDPQGGTWHRIGDVGYLDAEGRFWYCGRKGHRVETSDGPHYTACIEGIVNRFDGVKRSALVGVGPTGRKRLAVAIELDANQRDAAGVIDAICKAAEGDKALSEVAHWLVHPGLPVDLRHNAKINREAVASWASAILDSTASKSAAPSINPQTD